MKIFVTISTSLSGWVGEVFEIDIDSGSVVHIDKCKIKACGIDVYNSDIYCTSYQEGFLIAYDKNYDLKWQKSIAGEGLHTVKVINEELVVTDTYSERIVIFDLLGNKCRIINIPRQLGYERKSLYAHVNATAFHGKDLYYIVRFIGEGIDDGFVVDKNHVPIISGLEMPHSLVIKNNYIYFCNSWKFTLEKYTLLGEFVSSINLKGYTRGLCNIGNIWVVGLSCQRDLHEKRTLRKHASVVVLEENQGSWKVKKVIDLPNNVKEIFDIVNKSA